MHIISLDGFGEVCPEPCHQHRPESHNIPSRLVLLLLILGQDRLWSILCGLGIKHDALALFLVNVFDDIVPVTRDLSGIVVVGTLH